MTKPLTLASPEMAKTVERLQRKITKSRKSAIRFLQSAGIVDGNGELAKEYRDDQPHEIDREKL